MILVGRWGFVGVVGRKGVGKSWLIAGRLLACLMGEITYFCING